MQPYNRVRDLLYQQGFKPLATGENGTDLKAFCPAHRDVKDRSLTVSWKNGTLFLHCWCNCKYNDILHALGTSQHEVYEGCERPDSWRRGQPRRKPGQPRPTTEPAKPPDRDWSKRAENYCWRAQHQYKAKVEDLARELGVTVYSLERLKVGYDAGCEDGEAVDKIWEQPRWTFPFRNAEAAVVGIHNRFGDGSKRSLGKNGLVFDRTLLEARKGFILCVEGATDVAAGLSMGLQVVGRASNRTNGEDLGELVARPTYEGNCQLIIIGENDRTVIDGKEQWPGRDGMVKVAQDAANRLGAKVLMALPPDGAKDTRAWLNAQAADLSSNELLAALGEKFINLVMIAAVEVSPENPPDQDTNNYPIKDNCDFEDVKAYADRHCRGARTCARRGMQQLEDSKDPDYGKIICTRCWTWKCSGCAGFLKRDWEVHLSGCMWSHDQLYVWTGIPENWDTLRGHISNRLGGNYCRIKQPFGRIFLCSTVPFDGSEAVPLGTALERLTAAIDGITAKVRPISTSRGWDQVKQTDLTKRWKRVRVLKGDPARISLILREHALHDVVDIAPFRDGRIQRTFYFTRPAWWTEKEHIHFEISLVTDYRNCSEDQLPRYTEVNLRETG